MTESTLAEKPAKNYEIIPLPNNRPIAPSKLQIVGMLPGQSPIVASGFQFAESEVLPNHRPVALNTFHYLETSPLPGNRPVAVDSRKLLDANLLLGGRPIASNDDTDIDVTIGYLD